MGTYILIELRPAFLKVLQILVRNKYVHSVARLFEALQDDCDKEVQEYDRHHQVEGDEVELADLLSATHRLHSVRDIVCVGELARIALVSN